MTIMKTRFLMTAVFLVLAMTASAQIQLLFMGYNRNVIDRNKKLYWMDGDDDPCFNILNYKKAGTKETFTIKEKDSGSQTYSVTITLDSKGNPVHLVLKDGKNALYDSDVKTSSGSATEDERLYNYFGELAGYPAKQSVAGGASVPSKPSAADLKQGGVKGAANKVGNAAKGTFGKVKGLFKKKK